MELVFPAFLRALLLLLRVSQLAIKPNGKIGTKKHELKQPIGYSRGQ